MEDKVFGGPGIDTDIERKILNYRPVIEMTERDRKSLFQQLTEEGKVEKEDLTESPITDTYVEVSEVYDYLDKLVDKLEEGMKNTLIPVNPDILALIKDTPATIPGLENVDPDKGLPFEIYAESLKHPENPTYIQIQDEVEKYAEDINGNIALELYPDIKHLLMNVEELHYLLGKTMYNQLTKPERIPSSPSFDEAYYNELKEVELRQREAYVALNEYHELNQNIYYQTLANNYESDAYYDALEKYTASKRDKEYFDRRLNEQNEMASFARLDVGLTDKCAKNANMQIEADAYVEGEDVQGLLRKQHDKPEQYYKSCAQLQTIMKLQINNQIEEKRMKEDLLKTVGNMPTKKRVHNEVINLVGFRNEVFLDLYDMMNNMVDPTRQPRVERFFDQVAGGMDVVRKNYKTYLNEMYQIHMIDLEVRMEKLDLVKDKAVAREGYWVLDNLMK